MKSGIYIISSRKFPEKIYVGSSINIPARWNRHRRELKKKVHHNSKMTNHVSKYGVDDLYLDTVFEYLVDSLIRVEQTFINILQPFFNINAIAGSRLGS